MTYTEVEHFLFPSVTSNEKANDGCTLKKLGKRK